MPWALVVRGLTPNSANSRRLSESLAQEDTLLREQPPAASPPTCSPEAREGGWCSPGLTKTGFWLSASSGASGGQASA